jgi:hypothetical protein
MQGYCKGSKGPFILDHYNGNVEASMQGYNSELMGPHTGSL